MSDRIKIHERSLKINENQGETKGGVVYNTQKIEAGRLCAGRLGAGIAWDSIPLNVVRGYQLIDLPDHNMPFEMIPLKLKVDRLTKHRLLMLNTCNVDEYFQNTPADLRRISSQAPLGPRTTDLKSYS